MVMTSNGGVNFGTERRNSGYTQGRPLYHGEFLHLSTVTTQHRDTRASTEFSALSGFPRHMMNLTSPECAFKSPTPESPLLVAA